MTWATHLIGPILIFCLVLLTLDPGAKFDVSTFVLTGDNRGSQNLKVGHVTWAMPLLGPIFIFLFSTPYPRPGCKI